MSNSFQSQKFKRWAQYGATTTSIKRSAVLHRLAERVLAIGERRKVPAKQRSIFLFYCDHWIFNVPYQLGTGKKGSCAAALPGTFKDMAHRRGTASVVQTHGRIEPSPLESIIRLGSPCGGLVRDRLFVSIAVPNSLVCKLLFRGYRRRRRHQSLTSKKVPVWNILRNHILYLVVHSFHPGTWCGISAHAISVPFWSSQRLLRPPRSPCFYPEIGLFDVVRTMPLWIRPSLK